MGWLFSRRPANPLDAAGLRGVEAALHRGDLKAASAEVSRAREKLGDVLAVRYLEALVYHQAMAVPPADLLAHLKPALEPEGGAPFPEARLLEARLHGALGRFDQASRLLDGLGKEKLPAALQQSVRDLARRLQRLAGPEALREVAAEAEGVAAELSRRDLVVRWRASDLARLDGLLDLEPGLGERERARLASLVGEIACRAAGGTWRLALRPEERAVRLDRREWSPGRALADRLHRGSSLYTALERARGSAFVALEPVPGVEVRVEPGAHPAVVADHVARALLGAPVSGLAVFRERPTPDGPVVLPVSFLDKGGVERVAYIETRPWEPERLSELRRWMGRLRASSARHAAVVLLSAHPPPASAVDLVEGRAEVPPIAGIFGEPITAGGRSATPRSLDEPKLRWLDERAEMMERLVRAASGGSPGDLEMLKKVQQTVLATLRAAGGEIAPKHWNALYGYGALYGRILARSFGGRWTGLLDDRPPGEWEMLFPWGLTVWPIGRVLKLARFGPEEGDLIGQFLEVKAGADAHARG